MALGSNQPLTEMILGIFPVGRGQGVQCIGLTTLPPSHANCLDIWERQTFCNTQGLYVYIYVGYPESNFRWAIKKKTRIYYKPCTRAV